MAPESGKLRGTRQVLYLGVDVPPGQTEDDRASFRKRLGLSPDAQLVLHVGRFMEQKNHAGLISIFERVLETCPQTMLLLVGEGILKESIKGLVEIRGLSGLSGFLGIAWT